MQRKNKLVWKFPENKHLNLYFFVPSQEEAARYDWDAYLQNLILGCFFWGYICTELPGGRLAEVIGARRVFGYSMLCASIVTVLTPLACDFHYIAVIVLRVILGFMLVSSQKKKILLQKLQKFPPRVQHGLQFRQ